jgi:phosphoribosylformylglycinamidine cyclo-ligase
MDNSRISYSSAVVDYQRVDALEVLAQEAASATAGNALAEGMQEVGASRGESAYVFEVNGVLMATITECLGTKSLVADDMRAVSGRSHYDTIAQDTVAAAVNDLATVGATPLSMHAYWAAGDSLWHSDAERSADLVRGWQSACSGCGAVWAGGETPALLGLVTAGRIDLAASTIGIVKSPDRLTLGTSLKPGDKIVLLASSGIHANGVSLARKVAERLPNGYGTPLPSGRSYGEALLDPTVLYPRILEAIAKSSVRTEA